MKYTTLSLITAIALFSMPLYAEDATHITKEASEYKEQVIDLNKNIGTYYFVSDRLDRNIEDAAHIQVGSVQDFLINNQGEVEKIVSEMNDLGFGETVLNLDYADLSSDQNAFQLAYKAEEMEDQLATFLANIETAAGADSEELTSVRRLQGRNIIMPDGERIGQVEQVITDKDTKKIVGILMKDIGTRPEYERFALPYPNGLSIYNTGFENNLALSEEFAQIVQEFTSEGIPN